MANGRILVECELAPVQGTRFQPTGFPDLGPAVYAQPDGTSMILVDSPQAVVNHLESHSLTPDGLNFVDDLKGLSMVVVKNGKGNVITNSVLEGHRIASPYVLGDKERTEVGKVFDGLDTKKETLKDITEIRKTVFRYDVNSMLHGAWLSRTGEGRIRITRALSAFIEGSDARAAEYGGVKRDHVTTSVKSSDDEDDKAGDADEAGGDASSGMGSIPYHRVDYTAKIRAYFSLDLALIDSYNLGTSEGQLIEALGLWKIRKFLDSAYRPRTACDLGVVPGSIKTDPESVLPDAGKISERVRRLISECRNSLGGDNAVTTVQYKR